MITTAISSATIYTTYYTTRILALIICLISSHELAYTGEIKILID